MYESLTIQSHRGPYIVTFDEEAFARLNEGILPGAHFFIDARVAKLYAQELKDVLSAASVLCIEPTESTKSLDKFPAYVEHLLARSIRRGDVLIAVGGGVIQDITSFLAATLLRGLDWNFYPTTLLAQADSCIGSKSSINVGNAKNVLGTFTPPKRVMVSTRVLDSLDERDMRSGIGEMLKAHAVDGPQAFDQIAADYPRLLEDKEVLVHYICRSLEIKKRLIEEDEFDRGIRNVMNYGHSFGHAIESATNFNVPHGIAVTLGMDMANYAAAGLGLTERIHYDRMHRTLAANYEGFENCDIPLESFFAAIAKDKKNTSNKLSLIFPDASGRVSRCFVANDATFRDICADYLLGERNA